MKLIDTPPPRNRLGIIHLLGCTLGCAAVLAVYRANAPAAPTLLQSLWQLGMGLAYGVAASGLVLFLWRWWTGSGPAPSQPGHWLLVFGGVGWLLDFTTSAVHLSALRIMERYYGLQPTFIAWLLQQLAAWGTATLVGLVVLARLRGASRLWTVATAMIVLAISTNAVADIASLIGLYCRSGIWPWYIPLWTSVACALIALPPLWIAELADRSRRVPRDWLHYTGIIAMSLLGLVHFAFNLAIAIVRY